MSCVNKSEALALIRQAQGALSLPTNPVFGFFYCVSWLWRKVLWFPHALKKFWVGSRHPGAYAAGFLLNRGLFQEKCGWIIVAGRVASVVRPLIDLSTSCSKVRSDAKAAVKSVCGDKQIARVYLQAKDALTRSPLAYPLLFCRYVIPAFFKRAGSFIVNAGKVGWHSYDLYEGLTADDDEIVERSIAEIRSVVDQVGDGRVLQAIDFHQVWLKQLLRMSKTNVDLNRVKEIIACIGQLEMKSLVQRTVADMVQIIMEGILHIRGV